MANFLLHNGPKLDHLGAREPELDGATRLRDIEASSIGMTEAPRRSIDGYPSSAIAHVGIRRHSCCGDIAAGGVIGLGASAYPLALQPAARHVVDAEEA